MRKILLLYFLCHLAFPDAPYFPQECPIYESLIEGSSILCRGKRRETYEIIESFGDDYYFVNTDRCSGFLRRSCLTTPRPRIAFDRTAELAVSLSIELPIASDQSGPGFGYGALVGPRIHPLPDFRMGLTYVFRRFEVSRDSAASSAQLAQSEKYWGYQLLAGYRIESDGDEYAELLSEIWLEGGAEYLYPIGTEFTNAGNLMVAVFGITTDFRFGLRYWGVNTAFHAFHNFESDPRTRLMGIRFSLGAIHDLF